MDIRNSASSRIFLKSTSTSLGVRSFYLSGGEVNAAPPHLPPLPFQVSNSVAGPDNRDEAIFN